MSVSVVGMGCNQLGVTCDAEGAAVLVNEALESGINYFDVADEYGRKYWDNTDPTWGLAEEYLGRALRGHRDQAVIATKFGVRPPTRPELGGASAKWIATAVEESLRRLRTDRLDLYQLHLPDPTVPISETLTALDGLVRAGKVRAIGCSNLSAAQLEEADRVASELGTEHFVSTQERLNIFARDALDEVMPVCDRLDLKFIPYQPLARGILTGKYARGRQMPTDSRLFSYDISGDVPGQFTIVKASEETRARVLTEELQDRVDALESYAAERGHALIELAFAWLLSFPAVTTVIAGVARPGQAATNAASAGWVLTASEREEVTALAGGSRGRDHRDRRSSRADTGRSRDEAE
jgi:aryl-alcohol dehydrogenase-like predicted oxidoreductase